MISNVGTFFKYNTKLKHRRAENILRPDISYILNSLPSQEMLYNLIEVGIILALFQLVSQTIQF